MPRLETEIRSLTARDVLNPEVLTVRDDMTVQELATFLTENGIQGAPVVDDQGRLVGEITATELARGVLESGRLTPGEIPQEPVSGWEDTIGTEDAERFHVESEGPLARDIMTPALASVDEDTPVPELAKLLRAGQLHRLLVTRNGQIVGIVTPSDLLKLLLEEDA
jgi:CBS domain-containing protein